MKPITPFHHDATELTRIVQTAVERDNLSMNEISQKTGLAVPTIMRIYHGKIDKVQAKTVRSLVDGLGYDHTITSSGELKIKDRPQAKEGRLTHTQKERIMKAMIKVLREELDRL